MAFRTTRSLVASLLIICFALCVCFPAIASINSSQESDLRLELPSNGNIRIENLRGGVIAEFWNENYVSLSAISDRGQSSRSPAVIQPTEGLLSIRVSRGATNVSRINLELKIPVRAHAAIVTDSGSVEVSGLPAALLVQTVSGEIRAELPANVDADLAAGT